MSHSTLIRQVTAKAVMTVSPTVFLRTMPPENSASPGMVIISTMATQVSIQAVSPEFGEQLVSVLASHDGGAAAAAAAGASLAVSAKDACSVGRLSKIASISAPARGH